MEFFRHSFCITLVSIALCANINTLVYSSPQELTTPQARTILAQTDKHAHTIRAQTNSSLASPNNNQAQNYAHMLIPDDQAHIFTKISLNPLEDNKQKAILVPLSIPVPITQKIAITGTSIFASLIPICYIVSNPATRFTLSVITAINEAYLATEYLNNMDKTIYVATDNPLALVPPDQYQVKRIVDSYSKKSRLTNKQLVYTALTTIAWATIRSTGNALIGHNANNFMRLQSSITENNDINTNLLRVLGSISRINDSRTHNNSYVFPGTGHRIGTN